MSSTAKPYVFRQTLAGDQKELEKNPDAASAVAALKEFDQKAARLEGSGGGRGGGGGGGRGGAQSPAFAALNGNLGRLVSIVDGQDAAPTAVMQSAYEGYCGELAAAVKSWNDLMKTDLANLNGDLAKQGLSSVGAAALPVPACK